MFGSIGAVTCNNEVIASGSGIRFDVKEFSCGVRVWKKSTKFFYLIELIN